jgi:ribonuclease HI
MVVVAIWKSYPKATNNTMELNAVIAALSFLPSEKCVWVRLILNMSAKA